MYEHILSPVDYGGLKLKNRILFAPTTLGLRGAELEEKLGAIAGGGCAMVIIGDVPVSPKGPLSLYGERGAQRYRRLCGLVHARGCLICAQLHQSDTSFQGMARYLPAMLAGRLSREDLRALLNRQTGRLITQMDAGRAAAIAASFGPAARRAVDLGFDMIQVHGDRMCGSFSSSLFNRRSDAYGGSPEKRARFAAEAVSAVRRALPQTPIDYKLAVRQESPHYGNAGVLLEELPIFVPMLEGAGVTSFHVTLADHARLDDAIPAGDHPYFSAEGCFLPYCDQVRKYTRLPVCGVGGLTDPDFIERQLAAGRIDCAALSRQLIADPDWPNKLKRGQAASIRRCTRCNRDCLGGIQRHQGVHCIYEKGGASQ